MQLANNQNSIKPLKLLYEIAPTIMIKNDTIVLVRFTRANNKKLPLDKILFDNSAENRPDSVPKKRKKVTFKFENKL